MHNTFSVIGHEANESSIPLVGYFGESGTATSHQNLSDSVLELLHSLIIYLQKGLGCDLFGVFILQLPTTIFLRELLL